MTHALKLVQAGTPTNAPASVQIGDAPPLTWHQLHGILTVAGHSRPDVAATWLLNGTTRPTVVQRTAQDSMNEMEVRELREHRALLLGVLRKRLSPLRLRALDALKEWHFASTLAETLGVSHQNAGNICAALHEIGLLDKRDAPRHLAGRNPFLYRSIDAVHGPERADVEIESVRAAARRLRSDR